MEDYHYQASNYIHHLETIMELGQKIYPRGMEVREIADFQLKVNPNYPFMSFMARKYDVNYFKKEMLWKLSANQYNKDIMKHAKMWTNVINPDQTFNSNYGQYWFGSQGGIWSVVTELIRDPDSRRAVIPMLSPKHVEPWVVDTVCTEAVGFRIRDGRLDCSVHMRSSDSVYGLGTDIATFTFLMTLVRALVSIVRFVKFGTLTITAMSSHIYSKHYDLVEKIITGGIDNYHPILMPVCEAGEAMYLISKRGQNMVDYPLSYTLTEWLLSEDKPYWIKDE